MHDPITVLRALPVEVFETPKPDDAWTRCPLASAGDAVLIQAVAASIARPKVRIDSSFLLHAPLELLARASLLAHVPPDGREGARRRIAEIAVRYAAEGPEIEPRTTAYRSEDAALAELAVALRGGDADSVDSALKFLLPRMSLARLRAVLAEPVAPLLGAAGHAPILLMLLQQETGHFTGSAELLRSPLRALALQADRRLTWIDAAGEPDGSGAPALFECLAAPLHVETPSTSIAATMLSVEHDGYAARLLSTATTRVSVAAAKRILLRVAALSMLLDDPVHAPYGWTHCFTLPQAILSLADAVSDVSRVVRIAATHCLGFRATLGSVRLQHSLVPSRRSGDLSQRPQPSDAAAMVFAAGAEERKLIRGQLIGRAAIHADAHLAKYTQACLIAADSDPEESALYLAAAAYLGAWWDCQ
jgi:hypothetical protein